MFRARFLSVFRMPRFHVIQRVCSFVKAKCPQRFQLYLCSCHACRRAEELEAGKRLLWRFQMMPTPWNSDFPDDLSQLEAGVPDIFGQRLAEPTLHLKAGALHPHFR